MIIRPSLSGQCAPGAFLWHSSRCGVRGRLALSTAISNRKVSWQKLSCATGVVPGTSSRLIPSPVRVPRRARLGWENRTANRSSKGLIRPNLARLFTARCSALRFTMALTPRKGYGGESSVPMILQPPGGLTSGLCRACPLPCESALHHTAVPRSWRSAY